MKNPKIVFMGTADFAVGALKEMLDNNMNVAAVVTAPDKPAGRGRKLSSSPVKEFLLSHFDDDNRPLLLQPEKLKDSLFLEQLESINADLFIVVAFRMLPEEVWSMPAMGTINLHGSLLPHYRGAAPINRAIMNGETKSGVTTFFIDDKIDTGSILLREEVPIGPNETAGELYDTLMNVGAKMLVRTIQGVVDGTLTPQPQNDFLQMDEEAKLAPKIFTEDCFINWSDSPTNIHNFIRGLSPFPGARSYITNGKNVLTYKILQSEPEIVNHDMKYGTILSDGKHYVKIACDGGYISILSIQIEGKKRMNIEELLRGFSFNNWETR